MSESVVPGEPKDARTRLTAAMWMALIAAFLGWMFDGMEMGIYSIVVRPALTELLGPGLQASLPLYMAATLSPFLVGMAAGGILFGRLGDRIGRVRTMALSILVYATFTGLSGFSTHWSHLAICRFLGSMGLGGEWGAGVALVMETWPNASRPLMAGILGAAANFGFLASSGIAWLAKWMHWDWRHQLWCGATPAFLVFFLRLTVKEPERFMRAKERAQASRLRDLFAPEHRRNTLVGTGLGAVAVLGMWGTWQYWLPSWAPDLATLEKPIVDEAFKKAPMRSQQSAVSVADLVKAAQEAAVAAERIAQRMRTGHQDAAAARSAVSEAQKHLTGRWQADVNKRQAAVKAAVAAIESANKTVGAARQTASAKTMQWMALGSIVGAVLGGLIGDWLGRRRSYALLCLLSVAIAMVLYFTVHEFGRRFIWLTFLSGMPITAFFGWLPLYLPELYPTHLRATGEGFCFNVSRVISAVGVWGTGALGKAVGIPHAAAYMSVIFLLGLPIIAVAPETKGEELPE